jgi:uncharacterized protein (DUF362 family)/Pyruvate/2-oxoacid:ferredoxin oxidoreductase delta subunit
MDNNVYIIKCDTYDQVKIKLPELIKMMGGIEKYAARGEKIALKVNLLHAAKPEAAVTTHPEIVATIGRMLTEIHAQGLIVDSPGSGLAYNKKTLAEVYRVSEMDTAAHKSGCSVNFDCRYKEVSFPQGKLMKRLDVISPILEADGVFNLCKMKTHVFMRMTGAIKNNFGVIPGLLKPSYHSKLHDTGHFADMLLDVAHCVSPRLTIMDAVIGMEGDGPNAGTPKKIGLLIASCNQLAIDVVAGEIIGLSRNNNPVLIAAEKRGLQPTRIKDVHIVGESLDTVKIMDFKFPATIHEGVGIGRMSPIKSILLKFFLQRAFSANPVVNNQACKACGVCCKSCPEKAISIIRRKKVAFINRKKCIRCFCCHEMCQEKAIDLKFGLLHKLLHR